MKTFGAWSVSSALILFAAGLGFASPAGAQATRTWVSGVGDDLNPCSRTAPCKTFAGAISKTTAGGEINCLDPGGFGAVTITKAVTISCEYTEGGALGRGNGITVNAQPADVVYLRGLDIFGVAPAGHGVRFMAGRALTIENSTIRRFNSDTSYGISFQPTGASELILRNVTLSENGSDSGGGGIDVTPTGSGTANVLIVGSMISNNGNVGISAAGNGATVNVARSTIANNGTALAASGGATLASYGDNEVNGNDKRSEFTGSVRKQ